jgi:ABC-2 type transport system ATP-binding protein
MSPDAVLAVDGLGVRYGARAVLDGVSLEVSPGSVFALLGCNGAGKSSLVRCLLGLQKPAHGRAFLFGEDAWETRARALRRVGVVPEEPDAPPEMSARELVSFCSALYPAWDGPGALARLARLDVPLGIAFSHLSKGQKGAVMLALALAASPELLVLDDPTLGLDAMARRALYDELIGDLADRRTTVFVTTHDLAGIERIADRVAILQGTRLVVNETLDVLKARYRRLRCAGGSSWAPFETTAAVQRDWAREAVVTNYNEDRLAAFTSSSGSTEIEVGTLSLEEIFINAGHS